MVATTNGGSSAHRQMVRASIPEIAVYLQEIFGQKLTALMAGVANPKAVGQWARGEREPHPDASQRLRNAYYVASLLMQVESKPTVQAWFCGMNPDLDDHAPALVIGEDPQRVVQAARSFLAGE